MSLLRRWQVACLRNDVPDDGLAPRPAAPALPTVRADRVAYLVDADAYFHALVAAMMRAERSIVVLGWDIDARAQLPSPWLPHTRISLRRLLDRLARTRPGLRIHLLGWDFATLFALERLPAPEVHLRWRTHERVAFLEDAHHPPGASHHQKIVVIDDRVAFSGGLDLAVRRWDTPAHDPDDVRRRDKYGLRYHPFHDVQIAVSGPAAAELGAIARERWRRAGGGDLPDTSGVVGDAWPPSLRPDAVDALVEIAVTLPAVDAGEEPRLEVARSIAAMLESARRWVYVENQYFACHDLALRLKALLDDPAGPEVVMVAPTCCSGWLEQKTMGLLRRRFLATVRSGRHAAERFRALAPVVGDAEVFVHAKVLVVDDAFARVGSANWSTRSMALDTECDVTLVAGGRVADAAAVASLRNRLLAEHLGMSEEEVRRRLRRDPSLVRLVDAPRQGRRALRPLEDAPLSEEDVSWIARVADPERPLDAQHVASIVERSVIGESRRAAVRWAATAVLVVLLAVVVVALREVG